MQGEKIHGVRPAHEAEAASASLDRDGVPGFGIAALQDRESAAQGAMDRDRRVESVRDREPLGDDLAGHDRRVGLLAERRDAVAREHAIAAAAAPYLGDAALPGAPRQLSGTAAPSVSRSAGRATAPCGRLPCAMGSPVHGPSGDRGGRVAAHVPSRLAPRKRHLKCCFKQIECDAGIVPGRPSPPLPADHGHGTEDASDAPEIDR